MDEINREKLNLTENQELEIVQYAIEKKVPGTL